MQFNFYINYLNFIYLFFCLDLTLLFVEFEADLKTK